ncbi:unnamed protein product [Acanthoscelides obtectus]|uniref:Uncharacterized protein n=1 Tax=Acanthoscelides obtectus TaxID=200917 RepID=A0A9P0MN27_ACAOB|nr:unnamed protein product [Acanthoscelides obtectus]CAK1684078.1 hypothetical protein AOBTE_LOCUS34609 [Acanthoscelides obtectus]
MNLRLQQEISPSPTLLGSSSLHAMEKDHLPTQPICHKEENDKQKNKDDLVQSSIQTHIDIFERELGINEQAKKQLDEPASNS